MLTINHLPNKWPHYKVSRYRLDSTHALSLIDAKVGSGPNFRARDTLRAPGVELIIVQRSNDPELSRLGGK